MLTNIADGGNTFSDAIAITLPVMFEQSVGGGSDRDDYYSFTAVSDDTLTVSLTGLTADVDLHLYNPAGLRIAQSRTNGTAGESFTFDVTAGTQYILGITPNTSANSTYMVDISLDDADSGGIGADDDSGDTPDISSGPRVQEGGNSIAEPHSIQAPVNFSQSVGGADDTDDYFQITASESGPLVVSLTGLTADVDLHLYDAAGIRVASSRNSGTADEEFTFDVTAGTQYVLGITPTTPTNSPYQVSMTLNGVDGYDGDVEDDDGFDGTNDEDDGTGEGDDAGGDAGDDAGDDAGGDDDTPDTGSRPAVGDGGNSIGESFGIEAPVNFSQSVGGPSDTDDYFQLTAPESGPLVVSLTGLTADVDLHLFDAAGIRLASSRNSGTADEQFTFDAVEGTTYVLSVSPNTSENSPYQVSMTLNGEDGYDAESIEDNDGFGEDDDGDDVISEPHDLLAPVSFSQSVGGAGDMDDHFQFTAPESGTLVITLTGLTGDVDLFLYNAAGQEVGLSIEEGTADEQITFNVTADTNYVLGINANTTENTPYQVSMTLNGQAGTDAGAQDDPGEGFPETSSASGAHLSASGAHLSAYSISTLSDNGTTADVVSESALS